MRNYKSFIIVTLIFALAILTLSACSFSHSLERCTNYPDSEKYSIGDFTYSASEVRSVEIDWLFGAVKIEESESDELSVAESGEELSDEESLHYLLEDGVLKIMFAQSGALVNLRSEDKILSVQIPSGIRLSVFTTSASVSSDTLTQNSIRISTASGRTDLGKLSAEGVELESTSGAIRAQDITANSFECNTTSGSLKINSLTAQNASVISTSGSVDLRRAEIPDVYVQSTSGSIDLALASASDVKIRSTSGSVELTLSAVSDADIRTSSAKTTLHLTGGGAELSYRTTSGSLITSEPYSKKGGLYIFGDGESKISVESTSGSLEVE